MATTPPELHWYDVFDSKFSRCKIYIPAEAVKAYMSVTNWSEYADVIVGYNF